MRFIQYFALFYGVVFVLVALLGFIVSAGSLIVVPELAPRVLGLFPVNLPHNVFHLAWGIWGLVAARAVGSARTYAGVTAGVYAVLVVLGLITPTLFGIMPIGGNDVWLHALLAAGAAVALWVSRETEATTVTPG